MVPPGVCDAVGGRADRRVSWVRKRLVLRVSEPVAVLRVPALELGLQQRDAAPGRVDVRGDAERADAESAALPGGTRGRGDTHHPGGVHAERKEEVWPAVLVHRCWSCCVFDDQGVDVEGP